MKDKKKKARQLEREPYNEPIKQGKDKHWADQAESLLDKKKEAQPGELELNKDKDTGTAKNGPAANKLRLNWPRHAFPCWHPHRKKGFRSPPIGSRSTSVLWMHVTVF